MFTRKDTECKRYCEWSSSVRVAQLLSVRQDGAPKYPIPMPAMWLSWHQCLSVMMAGSCGALDVIVVLGYM